MQSLVNQYFKKQTIFAKLFNVSSQAVSGWLKGEFEPGLDVLIKLEKLTGITILEWCESEIIFDESNAEYFNAILQDRLINSVGLEFVANDSADKHTGRYQLQIPNKSPIETTGKDDPAVLREKIAILETTNLYRAGKIEELEARVGNLEARVKALEKAENDRQIGVV